MFPNSIIEKFGKTPWWMVIITWIPIILWELFIKNTLSVQMTFVGLLIGVFAWTFTEYFLHRFAFHGEALWLPNNSKVIAVHFLFHGQHHAFPMDKYRLVFPPTMSLAMWVFLVMPVVVAFSPKVMFYAISAGVQAGYVSYDMIHYWTHHGDIQCSHMKKMKRYHMLHHYRNGDIGFGVSNKFWDYVFKTEIKDA
jgi:4-hydroxysphinganine ceramide fatty acyl 2-hydroxylase